MRSVLLAIIGLAMLSAGDTATAQAAPRHHRQVRHYRPHTFRPVRFAPHPVGRHRGRSRWYGPRRPLPYWYWHRPHPHRWVR